MGNALLCMRRLGVDPVGIQGIKVNVSGHVGVSRSSLFKSFAEMAKWLGLANWVEVKRGASVTAGALID
ncbi:hypothetical protein Tco_0268003 [Tanacetum coccineum]